MITFLATMALRSSGKVISSIDAIEILISDLQHKSASVILMKNWK